jgi:hypothetical protein
MTRKICEPSPFRTWEAAVRYCDEHNQVPEPTDEYTPGQLVHWQFEGHLHIGVIAGNYTPTTYLVRDLFTCSDFRVCAAVLARLPDGHGPIGTTVNDRIRCACGRTYRSESALAQHVRTSM